MKRSFQVNEPSDLITLEQAVQIIDAESDKPNKSLEEILTEYGIRRRPYRLPKIKPSKKKLEVGTAKLKTADVKLIKEVKKILKDPEIAKLVRQSYEATERIPFPLLIKEKTRQPVISQQRAELLKLAHPKLQIKVKKEPKMVVFEPKEKEKEKEVEKYFDNFTKIEMFNLIGWLLGDNTSGFKNLPHKKGGLDKRTEFQDIMEKLYGIREKNKLNEQSKEELINRLNYEFHYRKK